MKSALLLLLSTLLMGGCASPPLPRDSAPRDMEHLPVSTGRWTRAYQYDEWNYRGSDRHAHHFIFVTHEGNTPRWTEVTASRDKYRLTGFKPLPLEKTRPFFAVTPVRHEGRITGFKGTVPPPPVKTGPGSDGLSRTYVDWLIEQTPAGR